MSNELPRAPWTDEQVKNLNEFQTEGYMHPFTCGGKKDGKDCRSVLVATKDGWICPDGCGYTQNWAHSFMLDGSYMKSQKETFKNLYKAE